MLSDPVLPAPSTASAIILIGSIIIGVPSYSPPSQANVILICTNPNPTSEAKP